MTTREDVTLKVRRFVETLGERSDFGDDEDLLEVGVLHSIQVVELILFVANTFDVELEPRDIYEGRLGSVRNVVDLVSARVAA